MRRGAASEEGFPMPELCRLIDTCVCGLSRIALAGGWFARGFERYCGLASLWRYDNNLLYSDYV